MITQSLTWCILLKVYTYLVKSVKESFVVTRILAFFDFITCCVKKSGIYCWLGKDLFTEKYYKTSFFYGIAENVWNKLQKPISKTAELFCLVFKNSLCLYLFNKFVEKTKITIDVALAIFLGCMFVLPHEIWNNLYFVIVSFAFGVWVVIKMASHKEEDACSKKIPVSIVAFLIAVAISTVTALVISDAIRFALFLIASMIYTFCVYVTLDSKEKTIRFIKILLFFVALTGAYGIVQRIMGVEVNLEFVDIYTNEGMPGRVFSTFSNPNNFAQLLVLFMPFYVPAFIFTKERTKKWVIAVGFIVTLIALAMTYSRSCWVGFALAALMFVCIYDKRLIIPAAILVVMAIPFLPETIVNRIFTIGSMKDTSNSYRVYIWESCLEMIKDFGITGLGLGPASFRVIYPGYSDVVALKAPHSHMLYMQIILEMGVIGAVSFFAYILAVVKKTAGNMRNMTSEFRCYAAAAISALFGIAFVCLAEYIWFYPRIMFAFWVMPGIMLALIRNTMLSANSLERK